MREAVLLVEPVVGAFGADVFAGGTFASRPLEPSRGTFCNDAFGRG
jgi:hypothetical protein